MRSRASRFGQANRRGQVKSILGVTRRMICRCVQRVEAMVFVFNFRTIGHDEADFAKTAHDVFGHLG